MRLGGRWLGSRSRSWRSSGVSYGARAVRGCPSAARTAPQRPASASGAPTSAQNRCGRCWALGAGAGNEQRGAGESSLVPVHSGAAVASPCPTPRRGPTRLAVSVYLAGVGIAFQSVRRGRLGAGRVRASGGLGCGALRRWWCRAGPHAPRAKRVSHLGTGFGFAAPRTAAGAACAAVPAWPSGPGAARVRARRGRRCGALAAPQWACEAGAVCGAADHPSPEGCCTARPASCSRNSAHDAIQ